MNQTLKLMEEDNVILTSPREIISKKKGRIIKKKKFNKKKRKKLKRPSSAKSTKSTKSLKVYGTPLEKRLEMLRN